MRRLGAERGPGRLEAIRIGLTEAGDPAGTLGL
jgi:hypothetical protein